MSEHMKDWAKHLTLLASVTHTIMRENQDLRETMKKMNQDHQDKMKAMQEMERLQTTQQEKLQATQNGMQEKLQDEQRSMKKKLQVTLQDVQAMQEQVQTTQESVKATEDETENLTEKIEELKLALTRYAGFPKVYRVERTENEVYLPGFYTHQHGYKMCIHVYPNGCGVGEGTHISIFTCLMKGLYDDHLKWPFRGNIPFQIVNQAGDHDHIENTIHYNDEASDFIVARVTSGEMSRGRGFDIFLPHSDLEYNAAKKTQYLKDDHFIVRVVKVELM